MKEKLQQEFKRVFGREAQGVYFAPGRVNLIGEHTDYNGGHVFPCALTIGTYAAAAKNTDNMLRFYSMNFEEKGVIVADLAELKKEEAGLLEFCKKYGLTLETYSAEELRNTEGEFASSDFVKQIAGVDNVCERSAVRAAGEGALILPKQAGEGVTVAAAVRKWSVDFE